MSITRLTQKGIAGPAYETPIDVTTTTGNWGWQGRPASVEQPLSATTRLGQFGVALPAYPLAPGELPNIIVPSTTYWGWNAFQVNIVEENVLTTTEDWGWARQEPVICSQDERGFLNSFNENVFPSCAFNDFVFGPRQTYDIEARSENWGWLSYYATVQFEDPVNIPTILPFDWGWVSLPISVSYGYDVQAGIKAYGWQGFQATVELPYDIALQAADWGWRGHPTGISYGTDVGATISIWGWQGQPVELTTPRFDIVARRYDWGWQGYPTTVRQTALFPGDIEAIADAVYQKFLDEGVLNQIAWVFQRAAGDPTYPQTFHTKADGHDIEVGPHTVAQTTDEKGNVTQTRQS